MNFRGESQTLILRSSLTLMSVQRLHGKVPIHEIEVPATMTSCIDRSRRATPTLGRTTRTFTTVHGASRWPDPPGRRHRIPEREPLRDQRLAGGLDDAGADGQMTGLGVGVAMRWRLRRKYRKTSPMRVLRGNFLPDSPALESPSPLIGVFEQEVTQLVELERALYASFSP